MKFQLTKPMLFTGVLWLAIMPWLSGGRQPVAVLIVYFALIVGSFLAWRLPDRQVLNRDWLVVGFGSFTVWSALSLIWSVNRYQTVSALILLVMAAATFALARQLADSTQRQLWLHGYLAIAAIFSVVGLVIYITADYNRLTSTFYWANPFAGYLMPAIIIGGWQYLKTRRWWYLVAVVPVAAAFILTYSRGAALVLVPIVAVGLWRLRAETKFWPRLLVAAALVFAVAAGANLWRGRVLHHATINASSRFAAAASEESTSNQDRLYYLRSALLIWRDRPLVGGGAGTYASLHPHYQLRVISASAQAHNYYVQTLAELGIIGFGLVILTTLSLLAGLYRAVKTQPELWPWGLAALALLAHIGLDIDASYPAVMLLVAAMAGMIYQPGKAAEAKHYQALVLAALLILCLPVIDLYRSQVWADTATAAQNDGDYQKAADAFRAAHGGVAYNPDWLTAEGINYLALARQNQEPQANLALARTRAETAMKLDPYDAQHQFLLARVLVQSGDSDGAEAAYKRTIQLDPYNNPEYYSDLAQFYFAAKRYEQAVNQSTAGLKLYTNQVIAERAADTALPIEVSNLYVTRAVSYLSLGQMDAAHNDFRQAVALDPQNAAAKQLLIQYGG